MIISPKHLLGANYLSRCVLLSLSNLAFTPLFTLRKNQEKDSVTSLDVLNQGSGATVLNVIRMGSNGQDVHGLDHVDASLMMFRLSEPQLNKRSIMERFGSKGP